MKHDEWKTGVVEYLFLNDEIVPSEQAVVHISTPAYRYATSSWRRNADDASPMRIKAAAVRHRTHPVHT